MTALPTNVDSAYVDDGSNPSQKLHQQHHDVLHFFYNLWEQAIEDGVGTWPDGAIPFWVLSNGQFSIIDPAISGSPGPQGDQGRGFLFMGSWSGSTTYHVATANDPEAYEVVLYGRHTYYAKTTHTNSQPQTDGTGQPIDSTQWGVFTAGGVDGVDGADGADGAAGPIGPQGPPGQTRDAFSDLGNVSGAITIDAADATLYKLTLIGDATIDFMDSSGAAGAGITLRVVQGSGAPHTITWGNILHWYTADSNPPSLGSTAGNVKVVVVDNMNDEWYGYSPGTAATPPAEVFPTLGMEAITGAGGADTSNKNTGGTYIYSAGSAVQIGAKRGGLCAVFMARDDSLDPAIPQLVGGGANWQLLGSTLQGLTGTTRRRLSIFACRDATAGAASQFSASVVAAAGESYTGALIFPVRTTGNVPSTWIASMQANMGFRQQADTAGGTEVSTLARTRPDLAAAADAANRVVACLSVNVAQVAPNPVLETADWEQIGTTYVLSGPTAELRWIWDDVSFDGSVRITVGGAIWALFAGEMEQG